ncbi:MAG TPA: phospho-N-acetylmuramoyl-pentapeptide-transferase [Candidatus Omnitrophota bacterium]|jgi:phospho-N-acetylmuramoyl-pentapeptide-transferase|nr:phospho-N-acetylmuramoyl-pentapeptide-transferase [Candidatus Omnitrophota bacterium]
MFYYLSQFKDFFFGFNVLKYITFRAAMAALTTFLLCMVFGPAVTRFLKEKKIKERALRDDCPSLHQFSSGKQDVPTMGGVFIIGSILLSVFLWADLSNRFILLTFGTCLYLAVLGGIDDYVKLTRPKTRGLTAKAKFLWQLLLAGFIGSYVFFSPGVSTKLDIPFFKDILLDIGLFYILLVAFIVIGSTNAVNLTDGLDGLAVGCILIVALTLAILCYVTGHANFSEYLFIPFIPQAAELTVFAAAMVGACLGFLWFNCYPASIFMGDTGSLSLGGTIALISILIKKELLLILLGGVFVIEALSVILQVGSFKLRKKRIFKMAPFHHHLQLSGWSEAKIIVRFWIINIILAVITLMTLKIR